MNLVKKNKVCVVEGKEALAIYDFNSNKFYRVGLELKSFFDKLKSGNSINKKDLTSDELDIVADCLELGLLEEHINTPNLDNIHDDINLYINSNLNTTFCWLEITSFCNQRCMHCFMSNELNQNQLSLDTIKKIVIDLKESGIEYIALTGGEPTLHKDFIYILDFLNQHKINTVLLTNGLNINEEYINKFKNYNVRVRIPLLGDQDIHDKATNINGSFEKCMKNIEVLKRNNIDVTITTTVMKINQDKIGLIEKIADDLDLKFELGPIFPIGEAKFNWGDLIPENYQDILDTCNYFSNEENKIFFNEDYIDISPNISKYVDCGTRNLGITSSGDYVPCLLLRDKLFHMGSIHNESITKLMSENNHRFKKVQELMSYNNASDCKGCEAKYLCKGGGCKAVSYLFNNDISEKNPHYSNCYY